MDSILYKRIKLLCDTAGITLLKLESELGFGSSSLSKWKTSAPSIDRVQKVADYFNVSTDYLIGRSNIKDSADNLLEDEVLINFSRAVQNMTPKDKKKSIQMLKLGFEYAFKNGEGDNDNQ